ncbi:Superfamily II DNA or RNA helicase [Faunimonas pinastri]|uniref:Superfamily II DNA or RNA helicase n=1 Tax=Faunimonas pinastri TaxID=1855383 RepID=A0A1H9MTU2_9HYPH|nr:DEAD/DEAH box helicase [Faunimonas pinastri]SER26553.1 Superfamily II DNA or RNA helicase [Faunimonas pinastri]
MTYHVTIAANATVAKLINPEKEVKDIVSELLSYQVEGKEFMSGFQSGTWDGRSSFFSHRTASFPAGFVHLVHSELTRRGHKVNLVRKPAPAPLGPENPIVDEFGNDDPRYDYQLKALRQVERHGRGIVQIATGGGKSKIAKLLVARYRRMTLFLTTRGVLMYQMKEGFESTGFNVGVVGDGVWSPVKGANVGMVQTLVARLQEPDLDAEVRKVIEEVNLKEIKATKDQILELAQQRFREKQITRARTIKFLEMVEVVIGEEAHEAGGNSYFEILRHCKNANIRVALTATPFMRDDAEDNMRLMAAFGPILIKVSEDTLIKRGILARPYFKFVDSRPHPKLRKTSPWQRAYQLGYTENTFMHEDIINDVILAAQHGLPVMTLIQRKQHGLTLKKAMQEKGLRVEFIQGENDQDARKAALKKLGSGKIDVLIGTTILDVGVDVPAVGLVQLAGGGKAEVALRQRIGRGLRSKKPPFPNVAFIADYSSNVNITLRDHTRQRRAVVDSTPGFAENVVIDFDWSIFKSMKKAA